MKTRMRDLAVAVAVGCIAFLVLTAVGQSHPTYKLRVESTAYAPGCGDSGRTATGTRPAWGTFAVDPRVIPLGSKIYVPGYGWGVARDTGGAIKGRKLDVWLPSCARAIRWGRRSVTITVVRR